MAEQASGRDTSITQLQDENEKLTRQLRRLQAEQAAAKRGKMIRESLAELDLSSGDFDAMLKEIGDHEAKQAEANQANAQQLQLSYGEVGGNVYWMKVENDMAVHKTDKVIAMILNGTLTLEKYGDELLYKAAWMGCADVIEAINLHWKGITPAMYDRGIEGAVTAGNFHIANQLYIGKMGKDATAESMRILDKIKREKAVNTYLCKQHDKPYLESTLQKVMSAIESRNPFSQDMLSLAWFYVIQRDGLSAILSSDLWRVIAAQMVDIIGNMQSLQRDFLWLTSWLLQSSIFYQQVDDTNEPLFLRANEMVNLKVNKEATARLNATMRSLQSDDGGKAWKQLQAYGGADAEYIMVDKPVAESSNTSVRQDNTTSPLKAEYKEMALRHFNAAIESSGGGKLNMVDHYNETVYLGQIHMKNAILNQELQDSVQRLLLDIKENELPDITYVFSKGPIKKLQRCLSKIDTKYIEAAFPSSSQILDISRCTIMFEDVASMLQGLDAIERRIAKGEAYSVRKVLRKKNLFRDYKFDAPAYCDVKLNVEVFHAAVQTISVVSEIQVMVKFMYSFKKEISHKLYRIQRQQEQFEKLSNIALKLTEFEPNLTAILAAGRLEDLMKYMIEHTIDAHFLVNYRFENQANVFHGLFRFDNLELYRYITKKTASNPVSKELLLQKFAEKDGRGSLPIYEVLKSNSVRLIEELCETFPEIMRDFCDDRTQLKTIHYASYKDNPKLLAWVFEHAPSDPDKLDELIMSEQSNGTTVFMWAAYKGMLYAMEECWKRINNADTKRRMLLGENKEGRNAFLYAAIGNHADAQDLLLEYCDNDEERAELVHHRVKEKDGKPGKTPYEWMADVNTFPSMTERIQELMKKYPLK